MPAFDAVLDEADVDRIKKYVLQRRAKLVEELETAQP